MDGESDKLTDEELDNLINKGYENLPPWWHEETDKLLLEEEIKYGPRKGLDESLLLRANRKRYHHKRKGKTK